MGNELNVLIQKLDSFIRKYYKNQILRGSLLSLIIWATFFLFASVSEYYGHFSILTRTIIFYITIALFLASFIKYIFIPVLQFFKIGKVINYYQASQILAKHFSHLEDKLQNTLELAELQDSDLPSKDLIFASIEQRISQIQPIPFDVAINFKDNLKYLKYIGGIIAILTTLLVFSPSIITEGTERIVQHDVYFEPAKPFLFILQNDTLEIEKGGDIDILVQVEGRYIPNEISIEYGGNAFMMKKKAPSEFSYTFKNINNSIEFNFTAEEYSSEKYDLTVLPTPTIIDFKINVNIPEYTGEKDFILNNVGDLTIPMGSIVKWEFYTSDIDSVYLCFNDSIRHQAELENNLFTFNKKLFEGGGYRIDVVNEFFNKTDIVNYSINLIPDIHPAIKVGEIKDSIQQTIYYFRGVINDDYGFKRLTFNYRPNENPDAISSIDIPITLNTTSQEFYYAFDFSSVSLTTNKIEYYFEVWDNDAVNGSKSARSSIYEFNIPSEEELEKLNKEANSNIEEKLNETKRLAEELKKNIKKLKENTLKNDMSLWQQTKQLEQIIQKQNQLEQLMKDINEINKERNQMMSSFVEEEMEIMMKKQQLEQLLEELMTDEMRALMEEFNKLLEEFDKEKLEELTEDLEMSYEEMSEQLDRDLEMLKQFEVEQKINKTIDDLNELADQQEQLSEDVKDRKNDDEELLKQQEEQQKKFEELMEQYDEAKELNKQLEKPMSLQDFQQDISDINSEFQQGQQNMQGGKTGKASKSQKKNAQQLEQLSSALQQMMQQNMGTQMQANIDDLRQILDNLVTFSFDQEELIPALKQIRMNDPKYIEIERTQLKLRDDFEIIKDSLTALAKRTPQLGSVVNKEVLAIKKNTRKALENLKDRKTHTARSNQQYVMTSANNLALLLSEVLEAMQMQMSQKMKGEQQCQKPGCGKPSLSQMKSQQQSMMSQLQKMVDDMKKGKGKGGKEINKQLGKMLAKQEKFGNKLSEMMNGASLSPEATTKLNEIKSMIEQTERELANKMITPTTMKRQNEILTRLLEAENAEYQREIDNKRESKEVKNVYFSNPKKIFEYKDVYSQFNELLKSSNIKLSKYYDTKYKEYLLKLKSDQ